MVKYFCDMCGEEIADENKDTAFEISINFGEVKNPKFVCPKCKKQICEQFGFKAELRYIVVKPKEDINIDFRDKEHGARCVAFGHTPFNYKAWKVENGYDVRLDSTTVRFSDEAFNKLFERID